MSELKSLVEWDRIRSWLQLKRISYESTLTNLGAMQCRWQDEERPPPDASCCSSFSRAVREARLSSQQK